MKQTAVEWLAIELDDLIPFIDVETSEKFIKLIVQAKEMEKQEIIDAYEKGDKYKFEISGEQYFNQTFKKD